MILDRVTFTGADDSVEPHQLAEISKEFPYVEWGVLVSARHNGRSPRFPSWPWIRALENAAMKTPMRLSLHLCGQWVRDFCMGEMPDLIVTGFERIQLNFHGEHHAVVPQRFMIALQKWRYRNQTHTIFQMDGVNDDLFWIARRHQGIAGSVYPLFDVSHGAGVMPEQWPAPIINFYCGYAGGLGPETIDQELARIEAAAAQAVSLDGIMVPTYFAKVWIDMESRVRSNNDSLFDLHKVRAVLSKVDARVREDIYTSRA